MMNLSGCRMLILISAIMFPLRVYASDMGTPQLWFFIFLVVAFIHSSIIYLITGIIVKAILKSSDQAWLIYIPLVIVALSFLIFLLSGFAFTGTVLGAIVGIGISTKLYFKVIKSKAVFLDDN